jgi:hypothetical protein
VNQLKRRFTVTHPFHLLYQRQFELLSYRKSWGRQFIDFQYDKLEGLEGGRRGAEGVGQA